MPDRHLALRITSLTIGPNGRAGRAGVNNRFVFQFLHPRRHDDNPTASFALGPGVGPVPPGDLDEALPDAIVFKGQPFTQVFDEQVRIRVHHLQDVESDGLQVVVGRVFESVLTGFLGQLSLATISLADLIDPLQSLKLGEDTYSQKLGYFELVLDPQTVELGAVQAVPVDLLAPEDICGFAPLGPSGQPQRIGIVKQGQVTASMDLELILT